MKIKNPVLILFTCFIPLFLSAQEGENWKIYAENQQKYPVVPADKLQTAYIGLQVDARLYQNRRYGFILLNAGFRRDEKSGKTQCFEAVFSDGTVNYNENSMLWQHRFKIAVELIAYDTRTPQKPLGRYEAVFYNISFDQQQGVFRCQIPCALSLDQYSAFVLRAKPPYVEASIAAYKEIHDTRYLEGPWENQSLASGFRYPALKNNSTIRASEVRYPSPNHVLNDYGYDVPEKHYEWTLKGSNYARSYKESSKEGMKASDGSILIPAQYDQIHFAFGGFMIASKNKRTGVVNEANQVVLPFEYERLELLYRNQVSQVPQGVPLNELRLLAYKEGNMVGLIDGTGHILAPFRFCTYPEVIYYYDAPRHSNGYILNLPLDYEKCMRETIILFRGSERQSIVNGHGEVVLPQDASDEIELLLQALVNNWLSVRKDGLYGLFDLRKGWLIHPKFANGMSILQNQTPDYPTLIITQFAVAQEGEEYPSPRAGLIDSTGKTVLPFVYDGFGKSFRHKGKRHFWVRKLGRWGVVDSDDQVVIPFVHSEPLMHYTCDDAPCFLMKDSLAKFHGVLSMENKMILPFQYYYIADGNGKGFVFLNDKHRCGLVNLKNKVVLEPEYYNISTLPFGYFYIQKESANGGIADSSGKIIIEPKYRGMYNRDHIATFKPQLEKKGISGEDVVVFLSSRGPEITYAFLKDGRLIALD